MDLSTIEFYQLAASFTLNPEEICCLNASMQQRQMEENLNGEMLFWGKLFGSAQDYLICVNINTNAAFPVKKYYFCTNEDYTLTALPTLSIDFIEKAKLMTTTLTGDPAYTDEIDSTVDLSFEPDDETEVEATAGEGEENDKNEENTDDQRKAKATKEAFFREIDRVAYIVKQIDHNCSIVPRGAVFLDQQKHVHFDCAFSGVPVADSEALTAFLHFRKPESEQAKAMLKSSDVTTTADFLDPICKDHPKELWSVGVDFTARVTHLRHQYWTGYTFFSSIERNETKAAVYGGAYFGSGIPNQDILFMI